MFSREVKTLLEKPNNVISDLMCRLREDFGDVFTVVNNQVYDEMGIEEIDKEKIERKVKEEEELDKKIEQKEKEKEEKIKMEKKLKKKKKSLFIFVFFIFYSKFF
jgi:hypothetical protein